MKLGSLFTGAGGLDLAAEAVYGATPAWLVEYDAAPSKVLAARFPGVPNYGDVTSVGWSAVEPVDIITAGYPCQPFSHAGKRKGTNDERHLWPYVAAAIGALRPRLVLLENVAGHLSLGGTAVVGDLASLGYDARWGVVRASDAGAPHRRARIFVAATDADAARLRGTQSAPRRDLSTRGAAPNPGGERHGSRENGRSVGRVDRDDAGETWQRQRSRQESEHRDIAFGQYEPAIERWERVLGRPAPHPTTVTAQGRPALSPRFTEWLMGWPDGWVTDVDGISRSQALKICGNGVVPQQAALAFHLLSETEAAA